MTVPNVTNSVSYTGPQDATLAYPFRIFQNADLLVTQTALDGTVSTLVLDTDYTVSGALSYTGGTITLLAGDLGTGVGLNITRAPAEVQNTSLQSQGAYDAKVVENAIDLLTMICQWLQNQADRALVVPPGTTPITLPSPEALALLQWNAGATGLQNISIGDLGSLLVSGNFICDTFAAGTDFTPGVTTDFPLSQGPGTVNNVWAFFDGANQQTDKFTLDGTTLTFADPVPYGVSSVQIRQAGVLPLNIPADGSVGTDQLANLAVTNPKLDDDSVDTRVLAAEAVALDNMASSLLAVLPQHGRNGIVDGGAALSAGSDYSASVSGTFNYGKSDLCKGALTGSTVAGTLTRVTNSLVGRTGRAFKWSAVTTTGSGVAKWRFFIEAVDSLRFKNQTATVSAKVRHDTGVAVDFSLNVYKANASDNFSAITSISAGSAQSVASATNGSLYNRAVSMGDCSNGICVEVTAAIGVVTNKNIELTEVQLELGEVETDFEFLPYEFVQWRGFRYYWPWILPILAPDATATGPMGLAASTTYIVSDLIPFPMRMRTAPSASTSATWTLEPGAIATSDFAFSTTANGDGFYIAVTSSGLTSGNVYRFVSDSTSAVVFDERF